MFNLLLHCLTYFLSCTQTSLSCKSRVWVKFQMIFEFELWFSGKQSNLLFGFIGFDFFEKLCIECSQELQLFVILRVQDTKKGLEFFYVKGSVGDLLNSLQGLLQIVVYVL